MSHLIFLIPVGQYDDLEGAAERILDDEEILPDSNMSGKVEDTP